MIQLIPQDEVVSISKWIPIVKAYKYEMRPTRNQEVKSNQTLSTCRHLYNDLLDERKKGWENGGWNVQYKHQQNYLPEIRNKNDETGKYLREVYEQVEQDVLKRVDKAYNRFFERDQDNKKNPDKYKKPGYPRFKGYGRYDSFTAILSGYQKLERSNSLNIEKLVRLKIQMERKSLFHIK